MRTGLSVALLAAILCASPLALAQRASLADRVAEQEQRASCDRNGTELVNQVSQLRAEVQELRGQIEQLQQQLEQARQSQRSQYLDLDGRLNRLDGSGGAPAASPSASVPAGAPVAASNDVPPASGTMAGMDERSAYNFAFEALKGGDYVESSRRFRDFLAAFPGGQYAPNGLYWLGESYYVTQNYALAADQFRALLAQYPTHDKAAGALLKLGLCDYGLGKLPEAERTLAEVVAKYPGTDVARTADDRLRAIQLGRLR